MIGFLSWFAMIKKRIFYRHASILSHGALQKRYKFGQKMKNFKKILKNFKLFSKKHFFSDFFNNVLNFIVLFIGASSAVSPSRVILSGDRPKLRNRPSRSFTAHPYVVILERSEESSMGACSRMTRWGIWRPRAVVGDTVKITVIFVGTGVPDCPFCANAI